MPSLTVSAIVVIISMIGIWQMRRWGVYTYVGVYIVGQIELILMLGRFNVTALLMRCLTIAILLLN